MEKIYRIGEPVLVDGKRASVVVDFGTDKVQVRFVRENGLLDSVNTYWIDRNTVTTREEN